MTDCYRKNVGIVVFNAAGKVLMCARADKPDMQWQFPQGGIEKDEDVIEAAKRELSEETGIKSITFVSRIPYSLKYKFPTKIFDFFRKKGCDFVGQEQSWVLFRFDGEDREIDFCTNPEEIEFKDFEWVSPLDAPKRIVYFKKEVYQKVIEFFIPIITKAINND